MALVAVGVNVSANFNVDVVVELCVPKVRVKESLM